MNEININLSEQFKKQSYLNRAYILGPHQIETLVVPIVKPKNHHTIDQIRIDNNQEWNTKILKTINNCYRKSPYFEHIFYLFEKVLKKDFEKIHHLNEELLTICLKILNRNKTICHKSYNYFENKSDFIIFNSKKRLENAESILPISYSQVFGNKFEANLSILDLLMMKGPDAVEYLF